MTKQPRPAPRWLTDLMAQSSVQECDAVKAYRSRAARTHAQFSGGRMTANELDLVITRALRALENASTGTPRYEAYVDWQHQVHETWRRENLPQGVEQRAERR